MNIDRIKEDIHNAMVEYACDTAYVTKMHFSEDRLDNGRYLLSDDGTEHCGYLVVKGCSFGSFWFDLYEGRWNSKDDEAKEVIDRPEVMAELNSRFSDVAVCLGPKGHAVDEKEIWRKIISLHINGDYSLVSEIAVMTHTENGQAKERATFSACKDDEWESVKKLSDCLKN